MGKPVKITANISENYTVFNTLNHHTWVADEPVQSGGNDRGPEPTQLFLSSLASCILITLRMYCERKQWVTGKISIDMEMEQLEGETVISKKLHFENQLEEAQLIRLLDIANRCPVAKIISNPVKFVTKPD